MLRRSKLNRLESRFVADTAAICGLLLTAACADGAGPRITAGSSLVLTTSALPALDSTREGRYVAWVTDAPGNAHRVAVFAPGQPVTLVSPVDAAQAFFITLELPGVLANQPSDRVILRGGFAKGKASLSVIGALTSGTVPLRERPGQFTMFTPSDNDVRGYPSNEEAGVWVFNMSPATTAQNDFYVRLTQLEKGWTYEGWMVRDLGSAKEIWLSYGKFLPDWTGALNQPDDTGWGPFSGVADYSNSRLEDFPGDDWISNPLQFPFPAELSLPLNLREKDAGGTLRWTHVITVEPMSDKGEPIGSERPFFLRLYRDPFGDLNSGQPRTITFHKEAVPAGEVLAR